MLIIEPSSRCAHLVPQLADGFAREWPQWAKTLTRAALEASFNSANDDDLPVVLVAHDKGKALGTIALREWFADQPMAESPWIRGLYVCPTARGTGVDRLLVSAIEAEARKRRFTRLYASTTRIEGLAVRRGWCVFRRLDHNGERMAWMTRTLA